MRVARAQRGTGRARRRRRRAQSPVLHHPHVVQQKTYLSLEGRVGLIVKRGVRGRERGRRRRHQRGQLALEQGDLPLERGDARFLGLEHRRERGARAAAGQAGRGQRALQLHLQRPQRVRRRLELLPVTRVGQPPPPPAAASTDGGSAQHTTYLRPATRLVRLPGAACRSDATRYCYCELAATRQTIRHRLDAAPGEGGTN